ncbi:MAG: protein kinase [Gemmatimonadota bacterium]
MTDPEGRGLPRIPELAEDFDLVREIGRGGTSVVYLARDRELGRDVAIKLIRPGYVRDEDALARLVREARTVGKLQHPSIVMLLGTRRLRDHGLALILQYVPGITLKQRIEAEGPLPFSDVEKILRDLGRALSYAHGHRIVHRDIKPENVFLDEAGEIARLADFGLARAWDSDSGLTLPGTAIGTPTYMSPEQVDGADLDGRSDLYSLGLVGYEMLAGVPPWAGESLYSVIYKQKHEELPPLSEVRSGVPENLRRAIEGAIQKEPGDRWPDARAFLEALGRGSTLTPRAAVPGEGSDHSMGSRSEGPEAGWESPLDAVEAAVSGSRARESTNAESSDSPASRLAHHPASRPVPDAPLAGRRARRNGRRRKMWITAAVVVLLAAGGALFAGFGGGGEGGASAPRSFWSMVVAVLTPDPPAGSEAGQGVDGTGPGMDDMPDPSSSDGPPGYTLPDPSLDGPDPTPGPAESMAEGFGSASGVPAALQVLGGEDQEGPPGETLPGPLIARVVDAGGRPVPGVPVVFDVLAGGGDAEPARTVSAEDGTAVTRWTLGESGRTQVLLARVEDVYEAQAAFDAVVVEGAVQESPVPAAVTVAAGGGQEGAAGQALPLPVEIRVVDGTGAPVSGVPVQFGVQSGGGEVEPAAAATDPGGTARTTWVLGGGAGEQVAYALVEGVDGGRVTFEATAAAPRLAVRAGVAVGGTHSCWLQGGGEAVCWGANARGQLGDGSSAGRTAPAAGVQVGALARLASGLAHVCGIDPEGQAHCWGANDGGQLGSEGGPATTPRAVDGADRFTELAAGVAHTCGLTRSGSAACWGANESGQLGDGTRQGRTRPNPVDAEVPFQTIVAGWRHTCALAMDGRAWCWGAGDSGQLGVSEGGGSTPRPVQGEVRFQALAAGNAHTCGLALDGRIFCWGSNEGGQLGTGSTDGSPTPQPVESTERFAAVTAGGVHTCGLTAEGEAYCWGTNVYGQIGDGTTQNRTVPVAVAGSVRFGQLDALGSHNCGRTREGEVLCWGFNVEGQLGDGTRENRPVPTPVAS